MTNPVDTQRTDDPVDAPYGLKADGTPYQRRPGAGRRRNGELRDGSRIEDGQVYPQTDWEAQLETLATQLETAAEKVRDALEAIR